MPCQLCAISNPHLICDTCFQWLPHFHAGCYRCGFPVYDEQAQGFCASCDSEQAPAYDHLSSLFHYQWPVDGWVRHIKFHQRFDLAHFFARRMAQALPLVIAPDFIMPVPLHIKRHRERGYNQSNIMAKVIGAELQRPTLMNAVIRTKMTVSQRQSARAGRWRNMAAAFAVTRPTLIAGKAILLIDDVITTGATVDAMSQVLKQHGASHVQAWSLCRSC